MKPISGRKALGTTVLFACVVLSLFILAFGFMYAWIMRDGLGPESYTSSGIMAYIKFAPCFLPCGAIGYVILLSGALRSLWLETGGQG